MMKQKTIFYFAKHQENLIKEWVIKHTFDFKSKNIYSTINETNLVLYKKSKNVQDLLIIEPKTRGQINIKNTRISYILTDNYISLYHINKSILDNVLKDIIEFLDSKNINLLKKDKYYPKVFTYKIKIEEEKIVDYIWEVENILFENVKIFFKEEELQQVLSPFENFYKNEELYNKIGLAYKIVSCFIGNPGLGKTTMVKYLAQQYSKDIYIFNDLKMSVNEFLKLYKSIPKESIILFDDFDKISSYSLSSFVSPFLNILDGVLTKHGTSIIFALNNEYFLEKTFPTITRVGRIDNYQNFNKFDQDISLMIIKQIYLHFSEKEIIEYIDLIKKEKIIPNISELKRQCLISSGNLSIAIKNLKNKVIT